MPEFTVAIETPKETTSDEDIWARVEETLRTSSEVSGAATLLDHRAGVISSTFQVQAPRLDVAQMISIRVFADALRGAGLEGAGWRIVEAGDQSAMPATPGDFDRYVTEHGIADEDLPEAFANWIAEQTGGPPPRFEKVDDDPSPDPDAQDRLIGVFAGTAKGGAEAVFDDLVVTALVLDDQSLGRREREERGNPVQVALLARRENLLVARRDLLEPDRPAFVLCLKPKGERPSVQLEAVHPPEAYPSKFRAARKSLGRRIMR